MIESDKFFNLFFSIAVIRLIMLTLFILMLISWIIFVQKIILFNSIEFKIKNFKKKFESGIDIFKLYQESQLEFYSLQGIERIFNVGFKEFIDLYYTNRNMPKSIIDGVLSVMRISTNQEIEVLEIYVSYLETIGYISFHVALIGTITSIIHILISIKNLKQISIQVISLSLANSLAIMFVGFMISIPSIIAYNWLRQKLVKIRLNYSCFMEELIGILYHKILVNNFNFSIKENKNSG